jgi:tetratricopeptide (TPR) repeat protein
VLPLVAVVVLAFVPALRNGFVDWDDPDNFTKNTEFLGLGWAQFRWAWTTFLVGVYQPLGWLLLEVQSALWGLAPWGYHLASLLFHAANAVVLYALVVAVLRRSGLERPGSPWATPCCAALAAAWFAVHPLRTEVVAWASCQTYLPCAFFALLTVLAYLRAHPPDGSVRRGWLIASVGLFVAALLCKAAAAGLPLVLLILDACPLGRFHPARSNRRALLKLLGEKAPFALVSVAFLVVAAYARGGSVAPLEIDGVPLRLAWSCYSTCFYPARTVLPLGLSNYYAIPFGAAWSDAPYLLSAAAAVALSAGLWLLRRRCPALLAVWASYLVLLGPNIGLVRTSHFIVADRYSYLSTAGLALLVAAGLYAFQRQVQKNAARGLLAGLAVAGLLVLALVSRRQCRVWHDTESLWLHALRHGASESVDVHKFLAEHVMGKGRIEEGCGYLREAVQLNPKDPEAWQVYGTMLLKYRYFARALGPLREAVRLKPDDPIAQHNLGFTLARQGQLGEAIERFQEAVRLKPCYAEAHNSLGLALLHQQRWEQAVSPLRKAVAADPTFAEGRHNLGLALLQLGQTAEAEAELAQAVRLDPQWFDARQNLGEALARRSQWEKAAEQFGEAVRLKPGRAEAQGALGEALARRGRYQEALEPLRIAAGLDPDNADAHYRLALVLARLGEAGPAEIELGKTLRLAPGHAAARGALARLREKAGH